MLWDRHRRLLIMTFAEEHNAPVISVQFLPDGSHLYSAARDKTVRLWKSSREKCEENVEIPVKEAGQRAWESAVQSPDGDQLLTLSGTDVSLLSFSQGVCKCKPKVMMFAQFVP